MAFTAQIITEIISRCIFTFIFKTLVLLLIKSDSVLVIFKDSIFMWIYEWIRSRSHRWRRGDGAAAGAVTGGILRIFHVAEAEFQPTQPVVQRILAGQFQVMALPLNTVNQLITKRITGVGGDRLGAGWSWRTCPLGFTRAVTRNLARRTYSWRKWRRWSTCISYATPSTLTPKRCTTSTRPSAEVNQVSVSACSVPTVPFSSFTWRMPILKVALALHISCTVMSPVFLSGQFHWARN